MTSELCSLNGCVFAAVNKLSRPLRKQAFTSLHSKGHIAGL